MQNDPNFVPNMFLCQNCRILGVFFGFFLGKIMNGWSDKLETWHAENLDLILKNARKQQFYPGSRSL